jgi:alpha-galactosidase
MNGGHVLNALSDMTNAPPDASLIWAAAPTPFLAYHTYFDHFDGGPSTSATNVLAVANRWLTNGMYAAGWRWMIISDGWEGGRDTNGDLYPNAVKFQNGMADTVTSLHQLGYKVGIYTSMGTHDSGTGFSGFGTDYAHCQLDMDMFARWGIDLLMVDVIGDNWDAADAAAQVPRFRLFANSVLKSGRQIFLYVVVESGLGPPYSTGPVYWETPFEMNTMPINGTFDEFPGGVSNAVYAAGWTLSNPVTPNLGSFFGPGHFPHIGSLTPLATIYGQVQLQAFFSMAAMISASIDSGDASLTSDGQYYTNAEVMAIDQDPGAIMPSIIWSNSMVQVWSKPLGSINSGSNAIALVNLRSTNVDVGLSWPQLGLDSSATLSVRDLWAQTTLRNYTGGFTNTIAAGTVSLYLVRNTSLDVMNLRVVNGLIITSNSYPITSWAMLGNCGCITWMSNATCYLICTNSINQTAYTNKLGGL